MTGATKAARRRLAGLRSLDEAVDSLPNEEGQLRQLHSVEECKDFIAAVNAKNDEANAINELSNAFLAEPGVISPPYGIFSEEYRAHVLETWRRISGRDSYRPEVHEKIPLQVEATALKPAAYQHTSDFLGSNFEAYGHALRRIDATPGMRVLEYGPGDAQISLNLARLGCDVTVVDIEQTYLDVIQMQAAMLRTHINTELGDFIKGPELGTFDRVLFFRAFHHSIDHQLVLRQLRDMLAPGGKIVFAAEPIIDPSGYWNNAVPYPWGLRVDCLSLRAIFTHGWMELGFQDRTSERR